ncbi:lysophospholipase [Plasmodium brasilianum]|uniref:Lysophospholipase, putative n=2 Tax=Plasmodium (Plasmodium) TaxID=418103 RepID=A0A1A8WYL0_PLAMA|nr:lysophospholipase [Plasmodium brasilianum]SBS98063.1 lysophospholipase, putative [Plasmodium malariae]
MLDSFFNKDGLLPRAYEWLVISNDKAILVDGDNYYIYKDSWIEHFNKNGYSVYGLDLQGHGQSDGWKNLQVNIKEFDNLVNDVIQYINKIYDSVCVSEKTRTSSNDSPNEDKINNGKMLPTYLIGHSMGGNIVLRTLQLLEQSLGK